MGKAKKRYYKLYMELRAKYPDLPQLDLYSRAIDIDQRIKAIEQAKRWKTEWGKR